MNRSKCSMRMRMRLLDFRMFQHRGCKGNPALFTPAVHRLYAKQKTTKALRRRTCSTRWLQGKGEYYSWLLARDFEGDVVSFPIVPNPATAFSVKVFRTDDCGPRGTCTPELAQAIGEGILHAYVPDVVSTADGIPLESVEVLHQHLSNPHLTQDY